MADLKSDSDSSHLGGGKVQVPLWIDREKMDRFRAIFGWRGAFPGFVNDCLDVFLETWGDDPTPKELIQDAVRHVIRNRV